MATPRGLFAPELLPEGWFDETLRPEGWFSQDFLEPADAGQNATANGVTVTAVYSFLPGTASGGSGAVDGTASGVTLSEQYSFIAGAASGQVNAIANGATVTENYSFVPGAASGQTNATASGFTLSEVYSFLPGEAIGYQNTVATGGAFGPNRKGRYYRRYDVYEVEADLERVAQSTQRSTSRKARKNQFASVRKSLGELLARVGGQSELPLSIQDLQAAYDFASAQAAENFAFAQWKADVNRAAAQALAEIRLQIEIMEEEDNDILLMVSQ